VDKNENSSSIREQVEARIREEAEKIGSGESPDVEITSKFIQDCLWSRELGDGVLFSVLHNGKYIFNKSAGEWLKWDSHHWDRDIRERALAHVEDVSDRYLQEAYELVGKIGEASKSENKDLMKKLQKTQDKLYSRVSHLRTERGRNACIKFARTNKEYALDIRGDELDQSPWLLACKNGVVDLRTGILRDGRPEDCLLKACPFDFTGIDTPAPEWEMALLEIFDKDRDLIQYLQRLLGYAITGLTKEHILPIFWGRGRNGKGTIVETISYVMGDLAGPIPTEMLLDQGRNKNSSGPTPEIMALRGFRIAFASEADEGRRFSPSRVKWLSGGDTLVGRSPHDKYPISFEPTHTLIMLTNDKPQAPAQDFAFWERVHLIPFKLSFVAREPVGEFERKADKDLKDKLRENSSGILAWLVRGCIAWQEKGLEKPAAVREATEQYRKDEDILGAFLDDNCAIDPLSEAKSSELYEVFSSWYEENVGKRVPSQRKFGLLMGKKFERSGRIRVYHGLKLLPENLRG
jgi:putative DNA primase/helicase